MAKNSAIGNEKEKGFYHNGSIPDSLGVHDSGFQGGCTLGGTLVLQGEKAYRVSEG